MSDRFIDLPLSIEEKQFLEFTHQVCREAIIPLRAGPDESDEFPRQILDRFREEGIFRAAFPSEFDGLGFHKLTPVLPSEVIAEYCVAVGTIFGVSAVLPPYPSGRPAPKSRSGSICPNWPPGNGLELLP